MNILLIGSGGREHALAWKIVQSPQCEALYCAPGNGGITEIATSIALDADDHPAVLGFCAEKHIDLVVIGPEVPLVNGLSDSLQEHGILVFGPSKAAAQLEGSKSFTKELCAKYDIPTADFSRFNNAPKAKAYLRGEKFPIVIKADGLAAGKGVFIPENLQDACEAVDECFEGAFGDAGHEVVIEEFLHGEEASMFFLCDGHSALQFGTAQDHKRVGEGDTGPNTGGMGAYSPAPVMTPQIIERTINEIILPTLAAMSMDGMPFHGVLYAGLMITKTGPQLIEYNVRFGDPECQVLMMRLASDLLPILTACAEGDLSGIEVKWRTETALTVVMAANGYPGAYEKGSEIKGMQGLNDELIQVFHAGTEVRDGKLLAAGGRVLNITALGKTVSEAQQRAYDTIQQIDWPEGFYRRDIGWRAIDRDQ